MRNNKYTTLLILGLFALAILSLYSNYKNYYVSVRQNLILESIARGDYEFTDEYIDRISSGYPSLTSTVIPFNSIIGAHLINNDSLDLGLEYLKKGNKDNPYLGFSDMLLAYVYQNLQIQDSFVFYAKEANRKLPNSPIHFALLGNILLSEEKLDSFNFRFKEITNRVPDREVYRVYLSAMVTRKYDFDTIEVYANARKAKLLFGDDNTKGTKNIVHLTADYVLHGVQNVKKSIELSDSAIDSYNNNPDLSIKKMKEATELVPDNRSYYEMLIEMLFKNSQFEDVIDVYDKLNDINMTALRANVIEFISISYLNTNDINRGCYLANILANNTNYNLSPDVRGVCRIF